MPGFFSNYYDKASVASSVGEGDHRGIIGGMWDEIGALQLSFLQRNGLTPDKSLLDIGCGSLRLGVPAVGFLRPGKYWGTDLNAALLDAGYEKEIIPAGLSEKLPRSNLLPDEDFTFDGVPHEIDFAMAQSVFTHLPLNHLRLCLVNLGRHLRSSCTFFFTIFTPPAGGSVTDSHTQPRGGIVTHTHRDPYHCSVADLYYSAVGTPWSIEFIGDWDHPRNQMIVKATKR